MDLPNLFSNNTKVKTEELILFVILSESKLRVALLELSKNGVEILDTSKEFEYESLDKCVEQTDLALQQLNKQSENVSETIFAVNTSWVKHGEVIDEKKPFVKKLSEDLSLKPLGFIDINESMAQQKLDENALFSGIIVVLTRTELLFTLIYQGKIKNTEVVGSSIEFKSDFTEGIARIQKTIEKQGNYLPPKLLLVSLELSADELHDYQQKIYDQNWEENTVFLQTPTIEILPPEKVLLGLSREAGKNAAVHKGLTDFALAASIIGTKAEKQEKTQQEHAVDNLDSAEFGFKDPLEDAPTSFGIPIKIHDFSKVDSKESETQKAVFEDSLGDSTQEIVLDKPKKQGRDWGHKKNMKWFIGLGFGLGLLVLIAGLAFGSSFIAKTEVEVVLNKKLVSKDIKLTLDTKAQETDIEKLLIAADTVTKKAAAKNTMQTTGIKIVGESATGKVSIYNKTDAVKVFDKGTQLKYGNLVFVTDEEITVASASAKQGGQDYGRADVTVTAAAIGAESNLEKGVELTVASYDTNTYNAYSIDNNFTGGSSREVRIVAQKDLDELTTDLREELLKKINAEFADESGNGTYILPSKAIINETARYSARVDTEAESVSLDLEIEVEAVTYSGSDLKPVAQEILSQDLPENYELEDSAPQILSSPSQTDLNKLETEAVVSIDANISSYAIPILSQDKVKEIIAGKPFSQAEQELIAQAEVDRVTFSVIPSFLSSFVTSVARSASNIVVTFAK